MTEILCPTCPMCSSRRGAPWTLFDTQWICLDENCVGLMWDPTKTLDHNLTHAHVVDSPPTGTTTDQEPSC